MLSGGKLAIGGKVSEIIGLGYDRRRLRSSEDVRQPEA